MIHYFDRSRMEVSHKCPRREYWEYYFDGEGLQPVKLNQHLAFGGAVHEAIANILSYCRDFDSIPQMLQVESWLKAEQAALHTKFTQAQGFQSEAITEMGFDGEMVQ